MSVIVTRWTCVCVCVFFFSCTSFPTHFWRKLFGNVPSSTAPGKKNVAEEKWGLRTYVLFITSTSRFRIKDRFSCGDRWTNHDADRKLWTVDTLFKIYSLPMGSWHDVHEVCSQTLFLPPHYCFLRLYSEDSYRGEKHHEFWLSQLTRNNKMWKDRSNGFADTSCIWRQHFIEMTRNWAGRPCFSVENPSTYFYSTRISARTWTFSTWLSSPAAHRSVL